MNEPRVPQMEDLDEMLPKLPDLDECPCINWQNGKKCARCFRNIPRAYRKNAKSRPVYWVLYLKRSFWKMVKKDVRVTVSDGIRSIQKYKNETGGVVRNLLADEYIKMFTPPPMKDRLPVDIALDYEYTQFRFVESKRTDEFLEKVIPLVHACDYLPEQCLYAVTVYVRRMFDY